MRPRLLRVITCLLLLLALPVAGIAQTVTPPIPGQAQAPYAPEQLDQLLAPIALYPDQLLGQILMAATYPLEVVEADRWLQDPANASLRGEQLAVALEPLDWDPSVKALVPFPQILATMDQHLDWTQALGDAFLAQQPEVMDSVQRLRRQALAAGNLRSSSELTVTPVGDAIYIYPANPEVIYVPVYSPIVVYGAWRYPAYPPYYFPPPPGFYRGPAQITGIRFSIGFAIISILWGWDQWDWDRHRLVIDHQRYNRVNRYLIERDHRPAYGHDVWTHDPYHRRGVVYRDAVTEQRFRRAPAGNPASRRAYRGFAPAAAPPAAAAARPAPAPAISAPKPTARPAERRRERGSTPKPPAAAQRPSVAAPSATVKRVVPTKPEVRQATPRTAGRTPTANRAPPPAFQGYDRGATVRAQAERGRASVQHAPTAGRPQQRAAPQSKTSPVPAPARQASPAASGKRHRPDKRLPDSGERHGQ